MMRQSHPSQARKEREVAWLRQLWAIESPGHPNAATVQQHYEHQLGIFRGRRLFHTVVRNEMNEAGLWFCALIDDALKREAQ